MNVHSRRREPEWVSTVMWWQVYPLGFVGAPIRPDGDTVAVIHRLDRIEAWLDHLLELGLNGLLLGPVFASASHGYDTRDHFRIDPRLGDERDMLHLIDAAHRRGIRVLLDGVFNHVGRTHPAFVAVESVGPDAPSAEMFQLTWGGWTPGSQATARLFEGHHQLVTLNHDSAAVENLVVQIMEYWLDRGIDGWRLDAAYAVPASFWCTVLPRVRQRHPDAWFLGEVIHGDYAQFVADSTIDTVTQYQLWQGIWHALASENLHELAHAIGRNNDMLNTFVPQTFVGNHDVTRIATAVGASRVAHALVTLFTLAGTPSIYAGDEYSFQAVKKHELGGDDAIRPEFAPRPRARDTLPAADRDTLELTTKLVALRRQHPWIHHAHTDVIHVTNTTLALRTAHHADALITVLNIGNDTATLPPINGTRVIAGAANLHQNHIQLIARGWAVLQT